MFSQMTFSLLGTIFGQSICGLVLAFYLMRLIQFFGKVNLGIQMLQSNISCIALAFVAVSYTSGPTVGAFSAAMIIADAIIGCALFYAQNKEEVINQFAFVKKLGL
jgi:NhaP-type Na+/H+ or K+/H+ antiporter